MRRFHWDAASNPLPAGCRTSGATGGAYVPGNRLRVWQDARYEYDEHGNLIERLQGKRGSAAQMRTFSIGTRRINWCARMWRVGRTGRKPAFRPIATRTTRWAVEWSSAMRSEATTLAGTATA